MIYVPAKLSEYRQNRSVMANATQRVGDLFQRNIRYSVELTHFRQST